jgi:hypothetical protein
MAYNGTMSSRERVLASIRHQEPDRVPVDLGATPSSGISTIAYYNLKNYLDISTGHTRVYDVVQQLAQPEDDILDRYGIDALDVGRTFNTRDEDWYDFTLPQGISVQFPAWFRPVRQPNGAGWHPHRYHAVSRHLLRSNLLPLPGRLSCGLQATAGGYGKGALVGPGT